jgi:tRNA (cmo5U34)-methyltransferase
MENNQSTEAYGKERASRYDQFAAVTMGDRRHQRSYLQDLLHRQPLTHGAFLDLGCGTGFFSEVFFEHKPDFRGHLVDGSADARLPDTDFVKGVADMLELARQRVQKEARQASFQHTLFDALDWSALPALDVVFSGYAIHHLTDTGKWQLFASIHAHLEPGGAFILFDNFLPNHPEDRDLIEFLTCREIERKTRHITPLELIIETDRKPKATENDHEASFEEHLRQLRALGFGHVVPVFLEARYGGIVAYK